MICGYFGHLYPGRGIEIILGAAKMNKNNLFIIFGGNENQINVFKKNNNNSNIIFGGFLRPSHVKDYMKIMDILLMPYQKSVSIGIKNSNTAEWMSPMKLFEYMSTGVPIVSSNLPVLREILQNKKNSLLVEPSNSDDWSNAIKLLTHDKNLYDTLSFNSYTEYKNFYTWDKRVEIILKKI
jgi:glycosyltransferase involved in cell wall biosynthesis